MQYKRFIKCLEDLNPQARVRIEEMRKIVDEMHIGVGRVSFRYFADFPGAQLGSFIWLDEERTSAYEEPYNDAVAFINDRYREDRDMVRLISAKELMHVFDTEEQRTATPEQYAILLKQIESMTLPEDASEQYAADRVALWKAIIALVPPCIRNQYLDGWKSGEIKAPEISTKVWLPEPTVAAAMGDYYEVAYNRYVSE